MTLFAELNKKETLAAAYRTLERYPSFCRIANEPYSPKLTATYSLEPKSFSSKPSAQTERLVGRKVDAEFELLAIRQAVDRISDSFCRQVVIEKYYRGFNKTDIAIYMDLGYSESEFYRLLERGVLEFAEAYRGGKLLVFKHGKDVSFFGRDLQEIR